VLGFSAVQLAGGNFVAPHAAEEGDLDLATLAPRLSVQPTVEPVVPGDDVTRRALGYVHANCSHCHNQVRPERGDGPQCFDPDNDLDFALRVGDLGSLESTAFFRTGVGAREAGRPFARGDVEESFGLQLMNRRSNGAAGLDQMPPLATEVVDANGVSVLTAFVESL
jgi:hypothetical protein